MIGSYSVFSALIFLAAHKIRLMHTDAAAGYFVTHPALPFAAPRTLPGNVITIPFVFAGRFFYSLSVLFADSR